MAGTISMTINGVQVTVESGFTILQACRQVGADVPFLCEDDDLTHAGACRLCVVESKWGSLVAACVTRAENGMSIETESPTVVESRKVNLELLAASHTFNCQLCEKNGSCKFQDYCYRYDIDIDRFAEGLCKSIPIEDANPFIERDYNKCISCSKCVRACEELTAARAISVINRGHYSKVAANGDKGLDNSPCVFCGQCIMVCPTGALISKVSKRLGRAYDIEKKVLTTCGYCGTGCTLELNVRKGRVIGVDSCRDAEKSPVNKGSLCVKGRFGWDFIHSNDRLTNPLIKENGVFRDASWEEAMDYAGSSLNRIKEEYGPNSLAVLSSARITNEENYLAMKMTRAGIGTNNIDHCARL